MGIDLNYSCLILAVLLAVGCHQQSVDNNRTGGLQHASTPTAPAPRSEPAATDAPSFEGQFVDLTHPFDEKTIYWPTEKGFLLDRGKAGFTDLGYYYSANRFTAAEHGGTHVDAPIHFFKEGKTVDQIPLDQLIGKGVMVDVSAKCAEDPDYQVSISDLTDWEQRNGRQLVDVIVLLKTGFAKYWPDRARYLGTDAMGPEAVKQLHFPGLDPAAAKWLVEHRAVKSIGIDTASIDFGQSRRFQSHVTLFEKGVPAFENVASLDGLPALDFT
ncbi:MAG: cyclase family protein, partial [Planctomycetales bacterium]